MATLATSLPRADDVDETARVDVLVIGAGFSGLYALHRLREMGIPTRVLEVWTETMPAQPEVEAYLNFVADRLDLRRDILPESGSGSSAPARPVCSSLRDLQPGQRDTRRPKEGSHPESDADRNPD